MTFSTKHNTVTTKHRQKKHKPSVISLFYVITLWHICERSTIIHEIVVVVQREIQTSSIFCRLNICTIYLKNVNLYCSFTFVFIIQAVNNSQKVLHNLENPSLKWGFKGSRTVYEVSHLFGNQVSSRGSNIHSHRGAFSSIRQLFGSQPSCNFVILEVLLRPLLGAHIRVPQMLDQEIQVHCTYSCVKHRIWRIVTTSTFKH